MDAETKQVLASICEMLQEQIRHYGELEKNFVAVLKALMDSDATFHQRFQRHIEIMNLASTRDVTLKNHDALVQLGHIIQRVKE